ncbi:MAG: FtsW/RodA/SpoVE family cell cycle protein [Bacteroidaceae bacterium]|nr:FtsW/RodA/SpoVE family cell cycle protein [Bacteroidaceae bacterium]
MGGDKLKRILFKGDKIIWAVFFIICAISWVEVFSATSRQISETENYWLPIIKHTAFLIGGLCVIFIMQNFETKHIKKMSTFFYWLGVIGLIWAQFDPNSRINGSARWINVFGLFTVQPMEFAKIGLVMMTAKIMSEHQNESGTESTALKEILKYSILPILIILKENLSTAALLLLALYMMMYIGKCPAKQLLSIAGIGICVGAIGITAILLTPDSVASKEGGFGSKVVTWKHRLEAIGDNQQIDPDNFKIDDDQRAHANMAIASSHIFGCGPGNSVQRDNIPHSYSDFIYAIIIEELGLVGGVVVLLLYLTFLYRSGKIANRSEDAFSAYLAMGIGIIITLQALLHMYISVGDFVTGQPLPLMSQGGTSVVINCIYIGMLLSISRHTHKSEPEAVAENATSDNQ